MAESKTENTVIIKKYANRRLYNTQISTYITLNDVCDMVKDGTPFVVQDAKTGEDLTKLVLTQIIFEQEAKGKNILPINFLRQLIAFYDDSLGNVLPHYLEQSMDTFTQNQEQMRQCMNETIETMFSNNLPLQLFEQITYQNMNMFQNALDFWAGQSETKKDK